MNFASKLFTAATLAAAVASSAFAAGQPYVAYGVVPLPALHKFLTDVGNAGNMIPFEDVTLTKMVGAVKNVTVETMQDGTRLYVAYVVDGFNKEGRAASAAVSAVMLCVVDKSLARKLQPHTKFNFTAYTKTVETIVEYNFKTKAVVAQCVEG